MPQALNGCCCALFHQQQSEKLQTAFSCEAQSHTHGNQSPTIAKMTAAWKAAGLTYNRYLAIASRAVRRSLKEEKRIQAERRGEMELRFARWENGKQGEHKDLGKANAAAMAEHASS